ncbi:MAG: cation diffusion facilitator family transporter [Novosphingobium sp.]
MAASGSARTLIVALVANLGIAAAKFTAASITGSSAMLTEGVHSVVDSVNQILLLYGRSRAKRPPDKIHPFGYGRELYFWSFVVAVLVFALGAGVSIYEGVLHIRHPEPATDPKIAFIVLAIAIALEGYSTLEAKKDFETGNKGLSYLQAIRQSKDAPTIVVLLENAGAVVGLVIAAIGLTLSLITHNPFWDGLASVLIGAVLAVLAMLLLYESKSLLIGEAADPALVEAIRQRITARREIVSVHEVLTAHLAPDSVTAIISADFEDAISARDVERAICEIEQSLTCDYPQLKRIYVRPQNDAG